VIDFLSEHGYSVLVIFCLVTIYVIAYKVVEEGPPTAKENQAILDSLEHRKSFLLNTTESKWGTE
jgi:hypothetical protein